MEGGFSFQKTFSDIYVLWYVKRYAIKEIVHCRDLFLLKHKNCNPVIPIGVISS